ncbi:hypothetical protein [Spirosoma fluminis]
MTCKSPQSLIISSKYLKPGDDNQLAIRLGNPTNPHAGIRGR